MFDLFRARLSVKYILFEMLPTFLLGVVVFILILLMFQALRLTEFVLVHGVKWQIVFSLVGFLSISFLPIIMPMSLLFSVLLTYGRLSADSEIVAFKSLGLSLRHLLAPAVLLSLTICLVAAQTYFYVAPWGNRQFEIIISDLSQEKATATLKEGVFSQGFFDMVVYASEVNTKQGLLKKVFIYDEREAKAPLTIIAREGRIVQESTPAGQSATLRLIDGDIHRTSEATYTKIKFQTYDIHLFDPYSASDREKSLPSFTIDELKTELRKPNLKPSQRADLEIEYNRRWALSFTSFIFGLLGVGIGTTTNKRAARGGGIAMTLGVIVAYWVLHIAAEGVARGGYLPASFSMWAVNGLFLGLAIWTLRNART